MGAAGDREFHLTKARFMVALGHRSDSQESYC